MRKRWGFISLLQIEDSYYLWDQIRDKGNFKGRGLRAHKKELIVVVNPLKIKEVSVDVIYAKKDSLCKDEKDDILLFNEDFREIGVKV